MKKKNGFSDRSIASEAGKKSRRGVSVKTKQWELLGDKITDEYTERVFKYFDSLKDDKEFFNAYMNILEYFKPKLNRTDLTNKGKEFEFEVLSDTEIINELKKLFKSATGGKAKA